MISALTLLLAKHNKREKYQANRLRFSVTGLARTGAAAVQFIISVPRDDNDANYVAATPRRPRAFYAAVRLCYARLDGAGQRRQSAKLMLRRERRHGRCVDVRRLLKLCCVFVAAAKCKHRRGEHLCALFQIDCGAFPTSVQCVICALSG